MDFGLSSNEKFMDKDHESINLPLSFEIDFVSIIWRRPSEYIPNSYILSEILNSAPSINQPQDIIKTLREKDSENIHTNDQKLLDYIIDNKVKLDEILNRQYNIYVVDKTQRELNEIEKQEKFQMSIKDNKSKTSQIKFKEKTSQLNINDTESDLALVDEPFVNNLSMNNWYSPFCTWIASIFQFIKDFDIRDAYVLRFKYRIILMCGLRYFLKTRIKYLFIILLGDIG